MADIDIKAMTDKLEHGDGCSLQSAISNMHFKEQEAVFDKLSAEAQNRPGNHLSFAKPPFEVIGPEGQHQGFISRLEIMSDRDLIFEALTGPGPTNGDVQNFCRKID